LSPILKTKRLKICLAIGLLAALTSTAQESHRGWEFAGGDAGDMHYSSLKQINAGNVKNLKLAWKFDSGDAYPGSGIEANPIVVNGTLYTTTPKLHVIALDSATGQELWTFDPLHGGRASHKNRGLTYWTDGGQARIFYQVEHDLLAIDANTGKLDAGFGDSGKVDMRNAFDRPASEINLTVRSPGVIYKDLLILGSTVSEWIPPHQVMCVLTMFEPGSCAGRFTLSRIQGSLAMKRGRPTHGKHQAAQTAGAEWLLMKSAERYSCQRAPQPLIFMDQIGTATTFSPIQYWLLMPPRAS
jgi:glucose dehydrogenase